MQLPQGAVNHGFLRILVELSEILRLISLINPTPAPYTRTLDLRPSTLELDSQPQTLDPRHQTLDLANPTVNIIVMEKQLLCRRQASHYAGIFYTRMIFEKFLLALKAFFLTAAFFCYFGGICFLFQWHSYSFLLNSSLQIDDRKKEFAYRIFRIR